MAAGYALPRCLRLIPFGRFLRQTSVPGRPRDPHFAALPERPGIEVRNDRYWCYGRGWRPGEGADAQLRRRRSSLPSQEPGVLRSQEVAAPGVALPNRERAERCGRGHTQATPPAGVLRAEFLLQAGLDRVERACIRGRDPVGDIALRSNVVIRIGAEGDSGRSLLLLRVALGFARVLSKREGPLRCHRLGPRDLLRCRLETRRRASPQASWRGSCPRTAANLRCVVVLRDSASATSGCHRKRQQRDEPRLSSSLPLVVDQDVSIGVDRQRLALSPMGGSLPLRQVA